MQFNIRKKGNVFRNGKKFRKISRKHSNLSDQQNGQIKLTMDERRWNILPLRQNAFSTAQNEELNFRGEAFVPESKLYQPLLIHNGYIFWNKPLPF